MNARLILVALGLVLVRVGTANAGACQTQEWLDGAVKAIEARAKDPKVAGDETYLDICLGDLLPGGGVPSAKSLLGRVNAACTTILGRDATDQRCVTIAVHQGKSEFAGVKLFDAVSAWIQDPWMGSGSRSLALYAVLGDPRVMPIVLETWTKAVPEAEKRERARNKTQAMMTWSVWRQDAAALIARFGTIDQKAFLEDQAKATKDRAVARACREAIATIDKRARAAKP